MNNVRVVKEICNVAKIALNGYVQSQNAKIRKYQNVQHILTSENEVLMPSTEESYMFDKNIWSINYVDDYIVLTKNTPGGIKR